MDSVSQVNGAEKKFRAALGAVLLVTREHFITIDFWVDQGKHVASGL